MHEVIFYSICIFYTPFQAMDQQQNRKKRYFHDSIDTVANEFEPPRKQLNKQTEKRCQICYEPSADTGCTKCQRCVHEKSLELRPIIIPCVTAYLAPNSR